MSKMMCPITNIWIQSRMLIMGMVCTI